MDQRDAELRADETEVLRAVHRAIVDVETLGHPAPTHRLLEHRQEGRRVLRQREGGVRDDARRIVEQREQVRLPLLLPLAEHARPVHHVAHPKLAGLLESEAPAILARRILRRGAHQTVTRQEPMHRRGREHEPLGQHALRLRLLDHQRHRQRTVLVFHVHEQVSDLARDRARLPDVAPRLRQERVEAALAPIAQPVADRLRRHAAAKRSGDVVIARSLLRELRVEAALAGRTVDQIGDQPIAKQGDLLALLVEVGVHWRLLREPASAAATPDSLPRSPRAVRPRFVLERTVARPGA